jgi:CobQ-like glutamine amidotransferase family enzyme
MREFPHLRLAYLFPRLMNLYSDTGNVKCLQMRCRWRGIALDVQDIDLGEAPDLSHFDLAFIGGGEDRQQAIAAQDLVGCKREPLLRALHDGLVCLAVCGGYQLFGTYYRPAEGEDLPGLGFIKASTRHPGAGSKRCVGNVVIDWAGTLIVGFENHGGRTNLEGSQPLGRVRHGQGNNGADGTEGAIEGNTFGTYLHGSLLPKNPALADELLRRALLRRGVDTPLPALDDGLEVQARDAMLARLAVRR